MGCVLGQKKTSMPASTYFHPLINRTAQFAVYIENWHTPFSALVVYTDRERRKISGAQKTMIFATTKKVGFSLLLSKQLQWWE